MLKPAQRNKTRGKDRRRRGKERRANKKQRTIRRSEEGQERDESSDARLKWCKEPICGDMVRFRVSCGRLYSNILWFFQESWSS